MIPNILTTARLILVPIFAYLMLGTGNYPAAVAVLLLSCFTDILDGYIARHYNMISNFGKVYDPFADKLMQITVIVCLAISGIIPWWIIAVIICKEIAMIVIGGILYIKKIVVYSRWYGKASTVIFYIAMTAITIWNNMPEWCETLLLVSVIGSMLFSAAAYLIDIIRNYDKKLVKQPGDTE